MLYSWLSPFYGLIKASCREVSGLQSFRHIRLSPLGTYFVIRVSHIFAFFCHAPKTDILFLEREIKTRKQAFGVEIYDLMAELEASDMPASEKESKIRSSFDQARKDIAVIEAKKECKKEEMAVLDPDATSSSTIPPSAGTVLST